MSLQKSTSNFGGTARPKDGASITESQVDQLEKLIGQLSGIHTEITALTKKSPNDAVNEFKLGFINAAISTCNDLLREEYWPLGDFQAFNLDNVPSNSDVTLVISIYLEALEKFRSDHVREQHSLWYYNLPGEPKIRTSAPAKLKK